MKLSGMWNGRRGTGRVGRKGRKHIGEADREESQGDVHRGMTTGGTDKRRDGKLKINNVTIG